MTLTPEKLAANRANAQHSTGPTSPEGKARSAANATKTGWFSRELQVPASAAAEFADFTQHWQSALNPQGALELEFFNDFLRSAWRKQQVIAAQNVLQTEHDERLAAEPATTDDEPFLEQSIRTDLDRLLRYEAQFERRAQRALTELRRLQTTRALSISAPADAPLADPSKIAAQERSHSAAQRAEARDRSLTPDLRRALALLAADSQFLAARARAHAAGLDPALFASTLDEFRRTATGNLETEAEAEG